MAKTPTNYSEVRPHPKFLHDQAVLVQAWKKSHAYIRSHNWYADSLELDVSAIRLRSLIDTWSDSLSISEISNYEPDSMRLVAAPKSSEWETSDGWKPKEKDKLRLRPLAHLSIREQTACMAVLICLADIVETEQGDPRLPLTVENQRNVVSYGHRLISRWADGSASFQWGNAKLYRQYFEDYQQFVRRPEKIRQQLFGDSESWAIVQIDLSQFYDLIPRDNLLEKLEALANEYWDNCEKVHERFFKGVKHLFDWRWHNADRSLSLEICGMKDGIGLPQGLAASGFFANAYLLDFDSEIIRLFGKKLTKRIWRIVDYCRYVDDMRFVVQFDKETPDDFRDEFEAMLQRLLDRFAEGLKLNQKKTVVMLGDSHSSNVPVAEAMQSVNNNVSGPLDVETARHALEMLDGLLAVSNSRKSQPAPEGTGNDELMRRVLAVEPDVRNDTLERFVAHRWRRVYRSLRVMADEESLTDSTMNIGRKILDQRARTFAVELLRKWILDPSNVRILRVSLDLFPVTDHLEVVLNLLHAHINKDDATDKRRLTAEYVGAEILRAGATETGFVRDDDELPGGTGIDAYRARLSEFATSVLDKEDASPWYLRQQALLFLAVNQQPQPISRKTTPENRHYGFLHGLLRGKWPTLAPKRPLASDVAVPLCLVAHRISGGKNSIATALAKWIGNSSNSVVTDHLRYIVEYDELFNSTMAKLSSKDRQFWKQIAVTAGYVSSFGTAKWEAIEGDENPYRLVDIITSDDNPFQQETAALRLMHELALQWGKPSQRRAAGQGVLTPSRIDIVCSSWERLADPGDSLSEITFEVRIGPVPSLGDERFAVPKWCRTSDSWKYEIGQIVRAAVIGKTDFTQPFMTKPLLSGVTKYRGVSSGWYKRKHGLFNDRQGLGHRLLAISPWLAELLGRLLEWPGTRQRRELVKLPTKFSDASLRRCIGNRLEELNGLYCRLSGMPLYPFPVQTTDDRETTGHLRVALVQTAIPKASEFGTADPALNEPATRRRHRRHVSAMLRLFMKLTEVREGYKNTKEKIDLVLFPELAVHSDDIFILERFADSLKCMVFCGLVFHPSPDNEDQLINTGLWIIPNQTSDGRSIRMIEQGKHHMTPEEISLGISSFRPCQWLIEYRKPNAESWKLSASICYDATDLRLAADLSQHSDAFIVSALNKDIGTFDTMVAALHYHMYQHVLLVNSAEFGGSTAQAPYKDHFRKVIMHHHGMDQASVSIFELDLDRFRNGHSETTPPPNYDGESIPKIKHPPAGLNRDCVGE
ncbi:reverse transcriptase domain-containing protein [Rubinisphaera italica]|uniref:Reverse transcriptase (RNA-dependent DNA polymerase) n=1 Tax=Rubinisphaera italica TaxID=2527969 RepID=A0A5C5XPQ7_9PLAN|nr:reverse transcriptase domain-containing protein [Rubinisphaera italica]TWT64383.1 Reverse transcriptase (RNA-dependent DNA polymerase) [Rubinisphaera italica]